MIRWQPIPDFPAYEVSHQGHVRNQTTQRILVIGLNDEQYRRVKLYKEGKGRWRKIGVLVLEAFVGPRPTPRHHCAHGNRGRGCDWITNLRWATPRQNERDKRVHGRVGGGGRKVMTSMATVARIHQRIAQKASYTAIAREEGLHRHSVARIAKGMRRAG